MSNVLDLSKCEKEIMAVIYRGGEIDTNDVRGRVNADYKHEWKIQTVHSFLCRLTEKGWLAKCKKDGKCYYKAIRPEEEFEEYIFNEALEIGFGGRLEKLGAIVDRLRKKEQEDKKKSEGDAG